MIWIFLTVVAVAVVAFFGALIMGRVGHDPMAEATHTSPGSGLPDTPEAADVRSVRFDTALRGYRMDQVDEVLDALQVRLADQEQEIVHLRDRWLAPHDGADDSDTDDSGA